MGFFKELGEIIKGVADVDGYHRIFYETCTDDELFQHLRECELGMIAEKAAIHRELKKRGYSNFEISRRK